MPTKGSDNKANMSREHLKQLHSQHQREIKIFMDIIFNNFDKYLFFNEFDSINQQVTSELFFSIFDLIYSNVPCAQNFLIMKAKFDKYC